MLGSDSAYSPADLRSRAREYLEAVEGCQDPRQRSSWARQAFELARRASLIEAGAALPSALRLPPPKGYVGRARRMRRRRPSA